jgi:hypothetical protein
MVGPATTDALGPSAARPVASATWFARLTTVLGGRRVLVESRGGNGRWFRKEPLEEASLGLLVFAGPARAIGHLCS